MRFKTFKIIFVYITITHFSIFSVFANENFQSTCKSIGFKNDTVKMSNCIEELKNRNKEKIRNHRNEMINEARDLPRQNQMLEQEKKKIAQRLFAGDKQKWEEWRQKQINNGLMLMAVSLGLLGAAAATAPAAGVSAGTTGSSFKNAPLWMCGDSVWQGDHCANLWGMTSP